MMRIVKIEIVKENEQAQGKDKQAAIIKNVFKTTNDDRWKYTYVVNYLY